MTATSKTTDTNLEDKVTSRLAALPDIDATAVEAHVDGTTVVLDGSVDNLMSARKVILAAETIDGVHDVKNHLTLTGRKSGQSH